MHDLKPLAAPGIFLARAKEMLRFLLTRILKFRNHLVISTEGCRAAGCRVKDEGCLVQGAECRVQGAGCLVQGARYEAE